MTEFEANGRPLLEVDDLVVRYPRRPRPQRSDPASAAAVRARGVRRLADGRAWRDGRARRGVRLRQDHDRAGDPAAGPRGLGERLLRRRRRHGPLAGRPASAAAAHADHLPGSVRVARSALPRRDDRRRATRHPPDRIALRAERGRHPCARAGGPRACGAVRGAVPARALRRPAPAGRDRREPRPRAGAPRRGRAGVHARRLRARRDPRHPRRAARPRARRAHDHARPLDGRSLRRPHLRHVPRSDRRGGAGPAGDREPSPSVHQGPALRRSAQGSAAARGCSDPARRDAEPDRGSRRLQVPSTLPDRDRCLPRDRPGASGGSRRARPPWRRASGPSAPLFTGGVAGSGARNVARRARCPRGRPPTR